MQELKSQRDEAKRKRDAMRDRVKLLSHAFDKIQKEAKDSETAQRLERLENKLRTFATRVFQLSDCEAASCAMCSLSHHCFRHRWKAERKRLRSYFPERDEHHATNQRPAHSACRIVHPSQPETVSSKINQCSIISETRSNRSKTIAM